MKNLFLTLTLLLFSFATYAQETVNIEGVNYLIDGDKAIITDQGKAAEGDIIIPDDFEYQGQRYKVVDMTSWAFQYCERLMSIILPNGITTIPHDAFHGCTELQTVTFGDLTDTIENNAFCDCIGITTINVRNPMPPQIEFDSFFGVDTNSCIVHVPTGSRGVYSNDIGWRQFQNIFDTEW